MKPTFITLAKQDFAMFALNHLKGGLIFWQTFATVLTYGGLLWFFGSYAIGLLPLVLLACWANSTQRGEIVEPPHGDMTYYEGDPQWEEDTHRRDSTATFSRMGAMAILVILAMAWTVTTPPAWADTNPYSMLERAPIMHGLNSVAFFIGIVSWFFFLAENKIKSFSGSFQSQ
ncbi:MAG: hypothetical protein VX730_07710 [Pseudomonadota bacterium]|nr:hypothetical protein [Pseudomonadota bacterium]